jgi:hypothetical protein
LGEPKLTEEDQQRRNRIAAGTTGKSSTKIRELFVILDRGDSVRVGSIAVTLKRAKVFKFAIRLNARPPSTSAEINAFRA